MRTFWRWWRSPHGRYFFYSRWQRLLHRFNFHHTRTIYPDGDTLVRCDWCGLSCVTHRAAWRGDKKLEQSKAASANSMFGGSRGRWSW